MNKNIGWFNGLIIDYILNRIWWIDVKLGFNIIELVDFNGNYCRIVLKSGFLEYFFGIFVF